MFVGGLSWETTQENLQHYFSRYGEIIDCVVMKNNETGRSRGFGFVSFSDPNNITQVLEDGHHELDGRTIDPKPCNPRSLRTPSEKVNYPKVFLGGLPSNITETDLRMVFGRFGKVMEVVIMYDQERKKSRGFGFISFESDACVDRAAQLHYITIHGKQVEIKRAEPRQNDNRMHGGNHENAWPSNQQEQRHNYGSPPVYEGYNNPNHYQQAQGQHFQQDYQGNMGGGSNNWSVPSNLNGPPVSGKFFFWIFIKIFKNFCRFGVEILPPVKMENDLLNKMAISWILAHKIFKF